MTEKPFIKRPIKSLFRITELVTVLSYELSPSYSNQGEQHDFWEMVFVDRGSFSCRARNEVRQARQGEIIFHKPNEFHSISCDNTHSASVFIITFVCKSPAMRHFYDRVCRANAEEARLIKRLIDECQRTYSLSQYPLTLLDTAPAGGEQLVRIRLEELLIHLLRHEASGATSGSIAAEAPTDCTLAADVCAYLQKNLGRRVTLAELSAHFHFGVGHLCTVFRRAQSDTILNYHTKLKINEAKRMLFEKKHSVSQIAAELGFESPEYFSRTFRKHTGMSPRDFQHALIGDKTVYLEKELKLNS